ncbi:cyclic nucleotide-binding domain-containing protein [Synechococcus elongatus IITB7]|uniref:Crp/Fnr family transcriptional regulator n=1 Tax=Synechococcus elongatus TaxID=32046 RepID=UPI0030D091BB
MIDPDRLAELQQLELLQTCPPAELAQLDDCLQPQVLQSQDILFRCGDSAAALYWIRAGQVGVFVADGSDEQHESLLRALGPGSLIGEMSLIDGQPRSATCRALEPTELYALSNHDFQRLLRQSHQFAQALLAMLSQRLRYTNQFLSEVGAGVQQLARGQYDPLLQLQSPDHSLASLAAAFAQMALQVQQREAALQERIRCLELEVDACRVQQSVAEITESEFFIHLQQRAQALRRDRQNPRQPPQH